MKLLGINSREPSRVLTTNARLGSENVAGIYDEILHGHPDATKAWLDMQVQFYCTSVRVAPLSDELDDERAFREICERVVSTLVFDTKSSTDIRDVVQFLAGAFAYGASVFELAWIRDELGRPTLNLAPVPLQCVQRWDTDSGRPLPVVRVGTVDVTIPQDRLIHVVPSPGEGPWGLGILRPLVFQYELWKQTLEDLGVRSGKEAGGIVIQQTEQGVSDEEAETVLRQGALFSEGKLVAWLVPRGYEASTMQLPPASSKLEILEYFDRKIRSVFDDTLQSLVSSDRGSRALGESVSSDANANEARTIEFLVTRFGRALFAHIAAAYEYTGRLPALTTIGEAAEDPSQSVELFTRAATLTGWHQSDREQLRSALGLEPAEEAGSKIEIAPQGPTSLLMSRSANDPPDIVDTPGLIEGRRQDEARLADRIGRISARLRDAAELAMADGILTPDERRSLEVEYIPQFRTAIHDYADTRREKARRWGDRLLERSGAAGLITRQNINPETLASALSDALLRAAARVDEMAAVQARTIFQRVVGEIENQLSSGGTAETRITDRGLAEGAGGVGHAAEQAGRLEGADESARADGLALVGAWRASFEDGNRCDHCERLSQTYYELDSIPTLPDPDCAGTAARCRCGLIPVFARPA